MRSVLEVRLETSLWPTALPWPLDLRFIRAVLVQGSQGSSTVQRHTDRLLFPRRAVQLSEDLPRPPSPQLRLPQYGINYMIHTKERTHTALQSSPWQHLYSVLQRNEMWSVDFSWWISSFCTTALEFVCFALRSASIMICHLHKIDKCQACWQWYKYLALPWCFRLTNLQRPPLDLLTVPGLMGNDDTDGLTANLPSGHLEQLSW